MSMKVALSKKTDHAKTRGGVEELELSSTAGGNVKWHDHFGKQFAGLL